MMNQTLTALAEPNRFHIVEMLKRKPSAVGEIAKRLRLRQPQVSKHLKILNNAGLVHATRNAQSKIYHLEEKPFQELDSWIESYKKLWNERLDRLDEYLIKMQEEKRNASKK